MNALRIVEKNDDLRYFRRKNHVFLGKRVQKNLATLQITSTNIQIEPCL